MITQEQTFFSEVIQYRGRELQVRGNCVMACYASYLDLDINHCPQVQWLFDCKKPEFFWDKVLQLWLSEHGYKECNYTNEADPITWGHTDYYFAWGPSPRGVNHQVIYKDGKLFHDPHPSKAGILEVEGYITLEKLVANG